MADVPDVSNAERSDDLSSVAVQAGVQHGQDARQQQEPDSEVQVDLNGLSSNRVSDQ